MKFLGTHLKVWLILGIALVLLNQEASAKRKQRKHGGRHHKTKPNLDSNEEMEIIAMMERDEAAEKVNQESDGISDNNIIAYDPCSEKHCGPGKICKLSEEGEATCICIPECPEEVDPRRKVCSNYNVTWGSDCALHQMRCWCQHGDTKCQHKDLYHMHIEYYGVCRQMEKCTDDQMADFPRRMRDWLFNVMRDLADREELSPYYMKMEQEAEFNLTKRWTNAAIWKWCDLEKSHDRAVSRHELFPIRAHLMALEHCIAPFLDGCDNDNDHKITLKEWSKCLEIDEDDIEEKCEDLIGDYD